MGTTTNWFDRLQKTIKTNEENDPNFYTAPTSNYSSDVQAGRVSRAVNQLVGFRHQRKLPRDAAEQYIKIIKTLQGR
jgi:hypothetical protein